MESGFEDIEHGAPDGYLAERVDTSRLERWTATVEAKVSRQPHGEEEDLMISRLDGEEPAAPAPALCMVKLPPKLKQAYALVVFSGWSITRACRFVGVAPGNEARWARKIRANLAQKAKE